MTRAEQTPDPYSQEDDYEELYTLSSIAIGGVLEVLLGRNGAAHPGEERWSITWEELHTSADRHIDAHELIFRQAAQNEIYELYKHGLEQIYPNELAEVNTEAELELCMAMIPGLPECTGSYTYSIYETADGVHRMLRYAEANLGTYGLSRSIEIQSDEATHRECYALLIDVAEMPLGTVDLTGEDSMSEREFYMLDKVNPAAYTALQKIFWGQGFPDDLDAKLNEIRILTEEDTAPDALDEIINYARTKYVEAGIETREAILSDKHTLRAHHVRRMNEIIFERLRQLEADA
jgi:hypothetical protein